MELFSEKENLKKPKDIQRNSLDERTRNRLHKILYLYLTKEYTSYREAKGIEQFSPEVQFYGRIKEEDPFKRNPVSNYSELYMEILDFLGEAVDGDFEQFLNYLKIEIVHAEWYKVFDLFEFIIEKSRSITLPDKINKILKEENSIYRFSTELMEFTNIKNEADKQNIDEALKNTKGRFEGTHSVMEKALRIFSDRNNPDYHNAIKDAVLAVELLIKAITGDFDTDIGKQIAKVCDDYSLPSDIKTIVKRLWRYASSENGVRHATKGEVPENISRAETLFIISSCSAIISYLVSMSENN